jgi:hypothetical protein
MAIRTAKAQEQYVYGVLILGNEFDRTVAQGFLSEPYHGHRKEVFKGQPYEVNLDADPIIDGGLYLVKASIAWDLNAGEGRGLSWTTLMLAEEERSDARR